MLKNLSPVITGEVLHHLDELKPGELLAVVSSGYPVGNLSSPVIEIENASIEETAEAVFSVLTLDHEQSPLLCWFPEDASEDELDIAFAVQGLASDAESRAVEVRLLEEGEFAGYVGGAVATFRTSSNAGPCAFLIRAGAH